MKVETKKKTAPRKNSLPLAHSKPQGVEDTRGAVRLSEEAPSFRTKKPRTVKMRQISRTEKAVKYANTLFTSFRKTNHPSPARALLWQRKMPVAMLLIIGLLAPSVPFQTKITLAAATNLIQNPSAETGTATPTSWTKGKWGTNTATFKYPAPGIDGAKSMRIDMTAYTTGDAKWVFANVPVKPGTKYVFSDSYLSNVATEADIQYNMTAGTKKFSLLGTYPASTSTSTKQFTFTPAAGTASVTIFHLISKVGYLVTDNYSLTEFATTTPPIGDTTAPIVAITAPTNGMSLFGTSTIAATATDTIGVTGVQFILDGTNLGSEDLTSPYTQLLDTSTLAAGNHDLFATAHDAAGNIATSSVVSFIVPPNDNGGGGGGDNILPTTAITAPIEGSTQSGTITVSINAADNIGVAGVKLLVDDVVTGAEDTVAPYSISWNTENSINGSHTLTAIARDASNNVATSAPVAVTTSNPVADTIPPDVHLIWPLAGTAVATTTPLLFGATDDAGVAGVTFLVDGIPVGSEDTVAPYEFLWNTNAYTNDSHIISASARDTLGNIGTSTGVSLTVNNIVLPPNLIPNSLLETVGVNGDPENWLRGGWGSNTSVFTYPTIGLDDGKAATIEITNYVNGDAKWYFADVPVTGGKTYSFTDSYKSNVSTEIVAQFQTPTGIQYQYIDTVPASAEWKTETFNIVVPATATALSVFHSIAANGSLSVDNFSLILGATPISPLNQFTRGLVSFSFDDGWITQYDDAFPILTAAGFKGTFYIITQETLRANPVEQITNASLDTLGANGDPLNWFRGGWGTNTVAFTYPEPGQSGGNAAKIVVSNYTDGDAKWYFGDTPVLQNEKYIFSDSYRSDATSVITLRYTYQDNSIQYVDIATLPSSGGTWKNLTQTLTIPANVVSMTAFHLLRENGSLTVDNYSLTMISIYINQAQMLQIENGSHEIGGHTQTHVSLSGNLEGGVIVTPEQANAEIVGSKTDLFGMGITSLTTMAYPYGDYNESVKTMAKNAGYLAARSVDRGFNMKNTDKYALKIQQMDRTTTMTDIQSWVTQAVADKSWLVLMFHQEDDNPAHDLGVTVEFLQQIVDYVKTADVDVVTVQQGVAQMNP